MNRLQAIDMGKGKGSMFRQKYPEKFLARKGRFNERVSFTI